MSKKIFQNDGRWWYPSAEVEVAGQCEYIPQKGGKMLDVTLVVHNTSDMSICTGSVTIKAETDRRKYLQTASAKNKIIPGEKIALSISVPYLDATERLLPNGVTVYNAFFD
jgi:hypothetical protein